MEGTSIQDIINDNNFSGMPGVGFANNLSPGAQYAINTAQQYINPNMNQMQPQHYLGAPIPPMTPQQMQLLQEKRARAQLEAQLEAEKIEEQTKQKKEKREKKETKKNNKKKKSKGAIIVSNAVEGFSSMPNIMKEFVLIVIIYLILSSEIVRKAIGNYIREINPDVTGNVSWLGILIYGIVLATLFIILKRFI